MGSFDVRVYDGVNPYDSPADCGVELTLRYDSYQADYLRLRRAMIGFLLTLIAIIAGVGAPMIASSDHPYIEGVLLVLYCLCPAIGVLAFWKNRTTNDAGLNAAKFRKAVIVGRQACTGFGICCILVGTLLIQLLPPQFQDGSGLVLMWSGVAFIACRFLCPNVPRISEHVVDLGSQ